MTKRAKIILALAAVAIIFFTIIHLGGMSLVVPAIILTYLKETDFPDLMEPTYTKVVKQSDPNKLLKESVVRNNSIEEIVNGDEWGC